MQSVKALLETENFESPRKLMMFVQETARNKCNDVGYRDPNDEGLVTAM